MRWTNTSAKSLYVFMLSDFFILCTKPLPPNIIVLSISESSCKFITFSFPIIFSISCMIADLSEAIHIIPSEVGSKQYRCWWTGLVVWYVTFERVTLIGACICSKSFSWYMAIYVPCNWFFPSGVSILKSVLSTAKYACLDGETTFGTYTLFILWHFNSITFLKLMHKFMLDSNCRNSLLLVFFCGLLSLIQLLAVFHSYHLFLDPFLQQGYT